MWRSQVCQPVLSFGDTLESLSFSGWLLRNNSLIIKLPSLTWVQNMLVCVNKDQSRMLGVMLYHSLSYFCETGSLTMSGSRLAAHKAQSSKWHWRSRCPCASILHGFWRFGLGAFPHVCLTNIFIQWATSPLKEVYFVPYYLLLFIKLQLLVYLV